jgi:hypothetical protein
VTGLDWTAFIAAQALLLVGIGTVVAGVVTRNRSRFGWGCVFAVVAIASVALSGVIAPAAGLVLIAAALVAIHLVRRRLQQLNAQTLERTGPTR